MELEIFNSRKALSRTKGVVDVQIGCCRFFIIEMCHSDIAITVVIFYEFKKSLCRSSVFLFREFRQQNPSLVLVEVKVIITNAFIGNNR